MAMHMRAAADGTPRHPWPRPARSQSVMVQTIKQHKEYGGMVKEADSILAKRRVRCALRCPRACRPATPTPPAAGCAPCSADK